MTLPLVELDAFGEKLRVASQDLSSYSPRLDRDVSDLAIEGEVQLGGTWSDGLPKIQPEDGAVLYFGADLRAPLLMGRELGPGKITAIGGHDYERDEIYELRRSQRVLPMADLEWDVAFRTAASELAGKRLTVSLNLNLLFGPFGLPPHIFLRDLRGLDGVVGLQIWTEVDSLSHAPVGAACLRETLLSWF